MSEMTLSQALRHSKKLKGQLSDHLTRAQAGVSHQADSPPAFAFAPSLIKANITRAELVELETRIALTNAKTKFDFDGKSMILTYAVRHLNELKGRIKWHKELPVRSHEDTTESEWGYSAEGTRVMAHVKWKCSLPEAQRAEVVDGLQTEFDRLNDAVERVNHATLLVQL